MNQKYLGWEKCGMCGVKEWHENTRCVESSYDNIEETCLVCENCHSYICKLDY